MSYKTKKSESQTGSKPGDEWFVLKGDNKYGPYKYMDMVKFLQQKMIFEFDFAWNATLSDWSRIADIEAFSQAKMSELHKDEKKGGDSFFRRHHKRVYFEGEIVIHNNTNLWMGKAVEISTGGVGVIMQNSMCVPGDTLFLHFKPSLGLSSFNAVCEVVSKKFVKGVKDSEAPIRYGLAFKKINKETEKIIDSFSVNKEAA